MNEVPVKSQYNNASRKADEAQTAWRMNATGRTMSKHAVPMRLGSRFRQLSFTKANPYKVRHENRKRNKAARISRRANRK